jgi:O-antigen ligase
LPLAFSYQPKFSPRQIQIFTLSVALMLIGSAGYTISHFFIDPDFYISEYKVSHMLPTLPKNDYIRSSMTAALFVIWCIYAWPQLTHKRIKLLVGVCVALLVAYIHVLAAKTGLLSFYLFVAAWGIYLSFGKQRLLGLAVIIAIPLTVTLALKLVPTLRERATYIGYTIYMYNHGHRTAMLGDIARLISYDLASDLIAQHPLTGVGTGDMKVEMDTLYFQRHPEIDEHGRLLPHNQFLVVGLGCGVPAMLVFIAWILGPLLRLRRNRQSFFFFIVWLILLVQLLIEPVLEVQFGVFVYLFFLLLHLQELGTTSASRSPTPTAPPTT